MIHRGAPLVQKIRELPNLIEIRMRGRRDRMDPEPGITTLQLRNGIVSRHRPSKRMLHSAKCVMKVRHAVQGELDREELQPGLREYLLQGLNSAIHERPVGRHIDLAYS